MLFTHFTVDQSKLTVNGSVLSDTPNVRYLVALYQLSIPQSDNCKTRKYTMSYITKQGTKNKIPHGKELLTHRQSEQKDNNPS